MKWLTLENAEATATLKQHCYIKMDRQDTFIRETYSGNGVLCGGNRGGCSSDGDKYDHYDTLEGEVLDESKACKKCLKKSKILTP